VVERGRRFDLVEREAPHRPHDRPRAPRRPRSEDAKAPTHVDPSWSLVMKLESMRTLLLRYVLTLIRDFAAAEDVAHEAVKSALANPDFDPDRDDSFGYVKQKALWLVRDRGRLLAKQPKSLPPDLIDHRSDLPAQALERHETCDRVRRAVARLSEAHKEVILRHLRGMSHEQVAADLDLPVRTVYKRYHHAKAALRRRLEEGGE